MEVVVACNTLLSQCRRVDSRGVQNIASQGNETEVFQKKKFISFSKESEKTMLAIETFHYKTN